MVDVAYGSCVGSWDKFNAYVVPKIGTRPYTALSDQPSITVAYNKILVKYREQKLDMLVLLHDDLELLDPSAESKFLAALAEPDVAIAGVCGGRGIGSLAWWNAETVGHQYVDSGLLDFGERSGDVDSVEGSVMALSPWAIDNLQFDENMTGFHCCDEIVYGAKRAGKRVVVVDVATHHHTKLGFKSEAAEREWFANDVIYREKWGL